MVAPGTYDACRNEARAEEDAALAPQPVARSVRRPSLASAQGSGSLRSGTEPPRSTSIAQSCERHSVNDPGRHSRSSAPVSQRALELNAMSRGSRARSSPAEGQEAHEFRPDIELVAVSALGPLMRQSNGQLPPRRQQSSRIRLCRLEQLDRNRPARAQRRRVWNGRARRAAEAFRAGVAFVVRVPAMSVTLSI